MKNTKKILITGSNGLIGTSASDVLQQNNYEIFGVDQKENFDICEKEFIDYLNEINPDIIVHAAAHPGGLSLDNPVENTKVNIFGTSIILNWCLKKKVHLVFTSSSAVYGDKPNIQIKEDSVLDPGTVYANNKVAAENLIKILSKNNSFSWTILRLFATYGSGHHPNLYQGIVNVMLTQILTSKKIIVKGSLERKRDLIYCDDVAIAIFKTISNSASNKKVLNIGTGKSYSIMDIISTICKILNYSFGNFDIIEEKGTIGDPMYSIANTFLATKIIGFKHSIDLEDGIKKLLIKRNI